MSTLVHSSTRPLDSVVLAVVLTGFVASTYGFASTCSPTWWWICAATSASTTPPWA